MELYYHPNLEEAMQQTLEDIKDYGFVTCPRGKKSKEILGYGFIIEDPKERIVSFKAREMNPYYLVGNLLWVLSQSNDLDFIQYYNPRGINFSDDGKTLRGAYGKRIFDFDGVNQWNQVVRELKIDPDSRRAIITFHLPQHDWSGSLDTPCTANIQFFIRNNKLIMLNHMRSQSAAMVMPYDIFLMTMLQELIANELGVELGYYQHTCNSIHYYKNEEIVVDKIIKSSDYNCGMNYMPKGTTYNSLKPLLHFERELREEAQMIKGVLSYIIDYNKWLYKLDSLNLDSYWNQFGYILILKALEYTNNMGYKTILDKLNPEFKSLF